MEDKEIDFTETELLAGYKQNLPYLITSVSKKLKEEDLVCRDLILRKTNKDIWLFVGRENFKGLEIDNFNRYFKDEKELEKYLKKYKFKLEIDVDKIKNTTKAILENILKEINSKSDYLSSSFISKSNIYMTELEEDLELGFDSKEWIDVTNPPKDTGLYEVIIKNIITSEFKVERSKYFSGLECWNEDFLNNGVHVFKWREI